MKKCGVIFVMGLAIGIAGMSVEAEAFGYNDHVQFPNDSIRDGIAYKLETFDLLPEYYYENGNFSESNFDLVPGGRFDSVGPFAWSYFSNSLEGLQYVKTRELNLDASYVELNQIGENASYEVMNIRNSNTGYPGTQTNGVTDLSFMKDLPNLKEFNFSTENGYALVDISKLSEFPSIEKAVIQTNAFMPTISLSSTYRKYELFDPILLSSQFADAAVAYSSTDNSFTNTDGLLRWSEIPAGTEYLNLEWTVENGDFKYDGVVMIPIVWK
ncbi:hypothetical protein [Enterococcus larvae]|uniref:hypothetical protein n=1 Tax=Enterococcus larvae TaxID=2794352 RepID=UPI003F366267